MAVPFSTRRAAQMHMSPGDTSRWRVAKDEWEQALTVADGDKEKALGLVLVDILQELQRQRSWLEEIGRKLNERPHWYGPHRTLGAKRLTKCAEMRAEETVRYALLTH